MRIKPHPEINWCDAEDAKVRELYNAGWELYDSAERLTQTISSIGNLLRTVGDILNTPNEVRYLKADARDQKLIIYLESLEDRIQSGRCALTEVEDRFREVRCELVQVGYKKTIPTKESGSEEESA